MQRDSVKMSEDYFVKRSIHGTSKWLFLALLLPNVSPLISPAFGQTANKPDFGSNIHVFNQLMPAATIQQQIDRVYAAQQHSEFGAARNALFFYARRI